MAELISVQALGPDARTIHKISAIGAVVSLAAGKAAGLSMAGINVCAAQWERDFHKPVLSCRQQSMHRLRGIERLAHAFIARVTDWRSIPVVAFDLSALSSFARQREET